VSLQPIITGTGVPVQHDLTQCNVASVAERGNGSEAGVAANNVFLAAYGNAASSLGVSIRRSTCFHPKLQGAMDGPTQTKRV
jgi:hypothetical protein